LKSSLKILLILSIFLSLNWVSSADNAEASSLFPDVNYFQDEIYYLKDQRIINGYKDGKFGPNDPIKRLQAIQMILKELGVDTSNAPNPGFKDVHPGSYGYKEIAKAAELGIISGKPDGNFDPNGILTRGQMAVILVNAYDLKGTSSHKFKDVKESDGKYPFVQTLVSHSIAGGYPDNTYRPNLTMNRGQFAAFLARYLNDDLKTNNKNDLKDLPFNSIVNNDQSVVLIELYDENDELISQGSGFIVSNQLIATNFHVISGGVTAFAITNDGDVIELDGVVEYDEYYDIALLKPTEKIGYPALPLQSFNNVKKGEKVVAFGSPYGMINTITEGIVSSKETFEDETGSVKAIQTSAKITYGSSGGPLLNMKGQVIGINSFGIEEINFAIATDYISEILSPYKNIKFDSIPTDSFSSMPFIDYEEPITEEEPVIDDEPIMIEEPINEEEPNDSNVTLPSPSTNSLLGSKQTISNLFIDVVHDDDLPIIYGIDVYGDLISYNYETKAKQSLSFDLPAESIDYENGKLFITLLKGNHSSFWYDPFQEGAIAIVDATTFSTMNIFDIQLDPYDIVADNNYFYVSSGSGQWTFIKSFDINSGTEISSQSIRQASNIFLHPSKNRIYAVDTDSSPRDMEVFSISDGIISPGVGSPYHGDYDLEPFMAFSPDGKYIFNTEGTIFLSSKLIATDMNYMTDLNTEFYDIAFNNELTKYYISIDKYIYEYDYATFAPLKSYTLTGEGYFLFNHKGNLVVVGEETSPTTGIVNSFVLKSVME